MTDIPPFVIDEQKAAEPATKRDVAHLAQGLRSAVVGIISLQTALIGQRDEKLEEAKTALSDLDDRLAQLIAHLIGQNSDG